MADNFNLNVDEDDIEELLQVNSKLSTNEELLELEQESIAEEEMGEKETAREEKGAPRKFRVKASITEDFEDFNKLMKIFENMDPQQLRFSVIEQNVHGALPA